MEKQAVLRQSQNPRRFLGRFSRNNMPTLRSLQEQIDELKKQNERILEALHTISSSQKESVVQKDTSQPAVSSPISVTPLVQSVSPLSSKTVSTSPSLPKMNMEESIGIRWFSWIGIAALAIGVGFFIKYAIDNNLISHLVRLLFGGAFGVGLVVLGEYKARTLAYHHWGKVLTGGGLAIIYFVVYAAYHFIDYRNAIGISQGVDIALLSLVALVIVFFSLRDNSQIIASEAFALGFITAILGGNFQLFTMIYASGLVFVLLVVVMYKRWPLIGLGGLFGTYILYSLWDMGAGRESFGISFCLLTTYFLAFTAQTLLLRPSTTDDRDSDLVQVVSTVTNSAFFYFFGLQLVRTFAPDYDAFFSVSLAAFSFIVSYLAHLQHRSKITATGVYLGMAFLIIAIPMQLDREWVTAAWAVLMALLVSLWARFRYRAFLYSSCVIGAILVLKIPLYDSWELAAFNFDQILSSTRFFSSFFSVLCFYYAYSIVCGKKIVEEIFGGLIPYLYSIAGLAVLVFAILLDFISDSHLITVFWSLISFVLVYVSFHTRFRELKYQGMYLACIVALKVILFDGFLGSPITSFPAINDRIVAFGSGILLFYGSSQYLFTLRKKLSPYDNYFIEVYSSIGTIAASMLILFEMKDHWISVGWGVLGVLLLCIGFVQGRQQVRYQGIVLLGLTIFKVFLYDTRKLSTLYRTISFIALGGMLLGTSFFYSKYKDKLKQIL